VVVPVQEDQGLLADDNEESIHQLRELGKAEQLHGQTGTRATPAVSAITYSLVELLRSNQVKHVRNSLNHTPCRKSGQKQVPQGKRTSEIKGLSVLHDHGAKVAHCQIGSNSNNRDVKHSGLLHDIQNNIRVIVLLVLGVQKLQLRVRFVQRVVGLTSGKNRHACYLKFEDKLSCPKFGLIQLFDNACIVEYVMLPYFPVLNAWYTAILPWILIFLPTKSIDVIHSFHPPTLGTGDCTVWSRLKFTYTVFEIS